MATKPWDARLASWLVRPLCATRVTPNQITTLGLVVGLAAAMLYARGGSAVHWGGLLYCLSALIDHADGELARATGQSSAGGQIYDRLADLVVKISLFAGMGAGLRESLGWWGPVVGCVAGVAFVSIFLLRSALVRRLGPVALVQPSAGPFELEDILYLIAPVTWLGWLQPFVLATAVGAPVFAIFTAIRLARTTAADTRVRYAPSEPR
jgi:phosphatidylglycerophosphate synthase